MEIEKMIPVFSMWKALNETIPALLNFECSENNYKKLESIVVTKEFLNLFVFNHNTSLTVEENNLIISNYKAFTLWLLGRFFHLLVSDNIKCNDLIVEAQLKILQHLSVNEKSVCKEIASIYVKSLDLLIDYHKFEKGPLVLDLFHINSNNNNNSDLKSQLDLSSIPTVIENKSSCEMMQKNVLKIVSWWILERAQHSLFTDIFFKSLNSVFYIVNNCNFSLKLIGLQTLINLLYFYKADKFLHNLFACVDQLIYKIYNSNNHKICIDEIRNFENLFIQLFDKSESVVDNIYKIKIVEFIIQNLINNKISNNLSENLKKKVINFYAEVLDDFKLMDSITEKILIKHDHIFSPILIKYFVVYLKRLLKENPEIKQITLTDCKDPIYDKIEQVMFTFECNKNKCNVKEMLEFSEMIINVFRMVKLQLLKTQNTNDFVLLLNIFDEYKIVSFFFNFFSVHGKTCKESTIDKELFYFVLKNLVFLYPVSNMEIIFHAVGFPYLKSQREIAYVFKNFKSEEKHSKISLNMLSYSNIFSTREYVLPHLFTFLKILNNPSVQCLHPSDNCENLKCLKKKSIEDIYYNIAINAVKSNNKKILLQVAKHLKHIFIAFDYDEKMFNEVLLNILDVQDEEIIYYCLLELDDILPLLFFNSDLYYYLDKDNQLSWKVYSKEFNRNVKFDIKNEKYFIKQKENVKEIVSFNLSENLAGKIENITNSFLNSFRIKTIIVRLLPTLIKFPKMPESFLKIFKLLITDREEVVRKMLCRESYFVLENISRRLYEDNGIRKAETELFFNNLFEMIKIVGKKSLEKTNLDLQRTVLEMLESASVLTERETVLQIVLILLLFIMIPTSKYQLHANNILIEIAKKNHGYTKILYSCYKKEICKKIVEISAINFELNKSSFSTSLEKISLSLGFFGSKDFVVKECRLLIPHLIPLVVKYPRISPILEEISTINQTDLPSLLAAKYGNIFLQVFLNESEKVSKECLSYLEKETGTSGKVLRKGNFQVILNELLLNFHSKPIHVICALKLLAKEESGSVQHVDEKMVADYLQPRLLGVLAYFDIKLISSIRLSKDEQVLLSLGKLIELMGAQRHITPVRFKIIAMLRTALRLNHDKLSESNCKVWEIFVKSCEIDCLGPQLSLIFISLLPLHARFPKRIERIFQYLIVENEQIVADNIPDLFFVMEKNVSMEICSVIRKHLVKLENEPFVKHLKWFLKYLNYESDSDIKVDALKYLKKILEVNREDLDRMILGYNGIDPVLVELLDALVAGCTDANSDVKLGCGSCIGELGAIEPSHLPRRFAQKSQNFTFFINNDSFIFDALNELIRALQAEKNTQNMDRFALAVQEMLKIFGVSPESNAVRHHLWQRFPESQREVMLPLLSSRYKMVQSFQVPTATPIYGSRFATSFQTWIHNWTCLLISAVEPNIRSLLIVSLPSLKLDNRTMMLFLPYVLLHALLEGGTSIREKIRKEFVTLFNSHMANDGNNKLNAVLVETRFVKTVVASLNKTKRKMIENRNMKDDVVDDEDEEEGETEKQCLKVCFVLFDFLERWLREWQWSNNDDTSYNVKYLEEFTKSFNKLYIARSNYKCGQHARALLYLEEYVTENRERLDEQLGLLCELYAALDEPDGVAGVMSLQISEPTIEQRTLALEVSGKLSDAAACYEKFKWPLKPEYLKRLMRCYLDLDNVNAAANFVEGVALRQPECRDLLIEMQAEPLWRLGHFDELEQLLNGNDYAEKRETSNCWELNVGKALLSLRKRDAVNFKYVIDLMRSVQVENLSATCLEEEGVAYHHGYGNVARLHVLTELEQIENLIGELSLRSNDENALKKMIEKLSIEWKLRMKVVQESLKVKEPILCIRRVGLEQAKYAVPSCKKIIDNLLGELWLFSARVARNSGALQQAYTYILKAEQYSPPKLFVERAKLHWLREEHELALTTLKRGVEELGKNHLEMDKRKLSAKAKLLIATYNDSLSNVDQDLNKQNYKEAIEVYAEWEKSFVKLAQYYDKIFQSMNNNNNNSSNNDHNHINVNSNGDDIQILMINYFGKSLQYGNEYVYQSMPRLLSIWFDYGTKICTTSDATNSKNRKENLLKMTKLIDTFLDRLPAYVFLTAFSQIVSRICHPLKEVYVELKEIIVKLLQNYPQQCLWMIMSVIKSSYSMRSKRCNEILSDARLKTPSMIRLIADFTKLAEKLIDLCNKDIPDDITKTSVSILVRTLPKLIKREDFSEIMIPIQKYRKLILPNPDFKSSQHNPFPNHYAHITGIEEEVVVIGSLQRPRKITFVGSDGKKYIQMLKPKDDLRKDFRLMEFNDIVNQLLSRDADSRQRRLNIRLYSVVPLNEECGLIEWIPNLIGLRPTLLKIYKMKNMGMKSRDLKQAAGSIRDPLTKKKESFVKIMLAKHPPVLGEWFRKTFPDAQTWLNARTAYIRTTAVMSMVGYVVGLGDRHGENILFDSISGDAVHVDFNCLFNKGESFEWPEKVPFRLTHNMVSAMGPLGVEGMFRKSCACTLRVLRANIETLMSVVTPFIYDPLVSWPKTGPTVLLGASGSSSSLATERTNQQAKDHIKNLQLRLQGAVKSNSRSASIFLSVDGQANSLIAEAMNVDNLCQMFVGWGPYL